VEGNDLLGYREPDTRATLTLCGVRARPIKTFKYIGQVLRRDTRAKILNGELGDTVPFFFEGDADEPSGRRMPNGILE
jgi:hypothetical protein